MKGRRFRNWHELLLLFFLPRSVYSNLSTGNGGDSKQITDFKTNRMFFFDWSRDGKQLAMARGSVTKDVVLIRNFR
jgi:hypothetical protein